MNQPTPKQQIHFVLCIHKSQEEDLETRKIYQLLPPAPNETGYLRVIDDSGDDYLYPAEYFVPIEVPQQAEKALLQAA